MAFDRIYLSPPQIGDKERVFVSEALDSGWIAPFGPQLDLFESEFAEVAGVGHAVATSSGTAALHLALRVLGIGDGDEVLVPTLTFCASVNPVLYERGVPLFLDSENSSWNVDPELLHDTLEKMAERNRLPKAVIVVHIYGQSADMKSIMDSCSEFGVPVIEDAAEALGATSHQKQVGSIGRIGIFSFNGNKIITSSGGGMLVTNEESLAIHARKLANQAREPVSHYEHEEIGFNYRMSNVLAALGRAQLTRLEEYIEAKRNVFSFYQRHLGDLPGITFMPEASWGRHTRWLTCMTINPFEFGADREEIRLALETENIESRPLWKPMHLQPVYRDYVFFGGSIAESLYRHGLCLPSGSNLSDDDLNRIVTIIRSKARV